MSGLRLHSYREGDRSEYLAVYLLSRLGLVTQVPRQEDIGFDLICNIADQEEGLLTFNHHYAVTVKSISERGISVMLAPPKSAAGDPNYTAHTDWLFRLELALMLAVVDRDAQQVSLYSTLPVWFLFHENLANCGVIELIPRMNAEHGNPGVDKPRDVGPHASAAGRRHYVVDLGFPIAVIGSGDLKDNDLLKRKKDSLRVAVDWGMQSARLARAGTPFFWWFNQTLPGGYIRGATNPDGLNGGAAWYAGAFKDPGQLAQNLVGLAPGIMATALYFKGIGRTDLLMSLRDVMRLLPGGSVPREVREGLPEIFAG
jgi:hypothetical protein